MTKLNQFPHLTVEAITKSKKHKTLVLFNPANGEGFKIHGDVAEICIMFSGKRTLETIINEFKESHGDVDYDIDEEIEKMLKILEEQKLIEYLDTVLN